MDIKYGTLTKRIDGVLNILYAKTTSDMVIHDDTSVKNILDSIASDLLTLSGQTSTIDSRISTACAELYNRIMGITDKKVCNYFNIPVLDLYHDGGHSSFQASYENCYTDSTFKDSNDNYVCYPNASTYRSINNKIENFIFSL